MPVFFGLLLSIFFATNVYAVDLLIDTGVGFNRISGIGVSGNSSNNLSFMLGGRAKIYSSSGKYFYAPGMRLSYYIVNREFLNTALSTRTDGMVYEQWSLTGLDSVLEFGRKFSKYECSIIATIGMGSVYYDGVTKNPSQLTRTRDTGVGFSLGIVNGIEITDKFAARLELGYRWYYLISPANPMMISSLITFQYTL